VERLTLYDVVRELNGELQAAGTEQAALVGHSAAGLILPLMVLDAPGLYRQLVFIAAAVPEEGQSIVKMMGTSVWGSNPDEVGFPLDPRTTPADELRRRMFCADMSEDDVAWLLAECAQDDWPPLTGDAPAHRADLEDLVPMSYIVTLRDGILPIAWQRRFARRLGKNVSVVDLDTPHEPFITHPAALTTLLCERVLC
jgi:pimeloyl-ACP methyl ester carboxylesterase